MYKQSPRYVVEGLTTCSCEPVATAIVQWSRGVCRSDLLSLPVAEARRYPLQPKVKKRDLPCLQGLALAYLLRPLNGDRMTPGRAHFSLDRCHEKCLTRQWPHNQSVQACRTPLLQAVEGRYLLSRLTKFHIHVHHQSDGPFSIRHFQWSDSVGAYCQGRHKSTVVPGQTAVGSPRVRRCSNRDLQDCESADAD